MSATAFEKNFWREANLKWMEEHAPWNNKAKTKLQTGYIEMLGETGNLMFELLKKRLPDLTFFHGVDNDADVLMKHILEGAPFPLEYGDFFAVALRKAGDGFGVFNFDTMESARLQWWENKSEGGILPSILQKSLAKNEKVVMIFNHVLDIGYSTSMTPLQKIQAHAKGLVRTFSGWQLKESTLLEGTELLDTNPRYEGQLGGFELYHSGNKSLRMVTTRLAFLKREKKCLVKLKHLKPKAAS